MSNIDKASDDTGLSDAADTTSTEDDGFDLDSSDVSWDDGEVTDDKTEDEAATESDDESEVESDDSSEDEPVEAEADTSDDTNTEESDNTPEAEADTAEAERKKFNDEMAKSRIAEKKARDELAETKKAQQEANLSRFLDEAADDDDRQVRENQVEAFRIKEERIGLNVERLESSIERAVAGIDLFKTGTPAVQARLLKALDQWEQANVQYETDESGKVNTDRPLTVKGNVYAFLQEEADSIRELLGDGARQQVAKKATQKSRTLAQPSRKPAAPKVDSDIAAFDEVVSRGW